MSKNPHPSQGTEEQVDGIRHAGEGVEVEVEHGGLREGVEVQDAADRCMTSPSTSRPHPAPDDDRLPGELRPLGWLFNRNLARFVTPPGQETTVQKPRMLLDAHTAIVNKAAFNALPDYSASLPTGTTPGKRWKRRRDYYDETKGWVLGEYTDHPTRPDLVRIIWRDLEIV